MTWILPREFIKFILIENITENVLVMNINHLIEHYGYSALILGSVAEGETITLLGGVAAHQGLLSFPLVVASVAFGSMIGDQLLYLLGFRFGKNLFHLFSHRYPRARQAQCFIQDHPYIFIIGTRFMYGFRIVGPLLIGASRLPPKIFLPLNIIGAISWSLIFTSLGYIGGKIIGFWL